MRESIVRWRRGLFAFGVLAATVVAFVSFEGGLVVGDLLRICENMSICVRILAKSVSAEAEASVESEIEVEVGPEVETHVGSEVEEQVEEVGNRVKAALEDQLESEVEERLSEEEWRSPRNRPGT